MLSALIATISVRPPSAQHLHLLPFLIFLLLLLHLPFIGVLLVSSAMSLAARRRHAPLACDLVALVVPNGAVFLALGVAPVLCLPLLFAQLHRDAPLPIPTLLFGVACASLVGQGLIHLYRRSGRRALSGLAGLVLLGAAYAVFFGYMALAEAPELWPISPLRWPHAFALEVAAQIGSFTAASTCLTGAMILAVYFGFEERRLADDVQHREAMRLVAAGALLAGALAAPPLILWSLFLTREPALSTPMFALAGLAMALLAPAAAIGASAFRDQGTRRAGTALCLALGAFILAILVPYRSQLVATQDRFALLTEDAARRFAAIQKEQEARYAKVKADLRLGEKVFRERCNACHAWDRRVVGPPYDVVLAKYGGRPDALAAFVRNPVKVDPAYPPMPAQGLTVSELASIVQYLLDEESRRNATSSSEGTAPARRASQR